MSEICPKCGLPKELCVCETIAREEQRIIIRAEKKRFGKIITIVEGMQKNTVNIKEVAKQLKNKLACGGTTKGNKIELQGNHVHKVKDELIKLGFNQSMIETQ